MFGPCFVMQYLVSFLVFIYLAEEEIVGCFTLIVFLLSCGCWCICLFLAVPLVNLWSLIVALLGILPNFLYIWLFHTQHYVTR